MKKVLLLSPYDARSHQYWRLGIVEHLTEIDFSVHVLPARHFSWRFRGNALSWHAMDFTEDFGAAELLLCTSMTDLSALKGMNPTIRDLPAVMYFHENQFAYPKPDRPEHLLERQVTSLYGALTADRLVFNSDYNRETFLAGVEELLSRLPDHVPRGIPEDLEARSLVVPVPLGDECFRPGGKSGRLTLIWNHRWESDKGIDRLEALVGVLVERGLDFRMHVLSGETRRIPDEIVRTTELLARNGSLGHAGFIDGREEYLDLLRQSHIVLSTAEHEFQGLAVLEAVASGCTPVVPDRLSYRELLPDAFRYAGDPDPRTEAIGAADLVMSLADSRLPPPDVSRLSWREQADTYRGLLA